MSKHPYDQLITLLGPTACGKTSLGVALALALEGSIISADSRQVYVGMDIGTGKDLSSYHTLQGTIPYYMIDIVAPGTPFSVYDYEQLLGVAYADIMRQGRVPILVGGTGLYIEQTLNRRPMHQVPPHERLRTELEMLSVDDLHAILSRYPRIAHADLSSKRKIIRAIEIAQHYKQHPEQYQQYQKAVESMPQYSPIIFGLKVPRQEVVRRIDARLDERLQQGMIEEVERLLQQGVSAQTLISYGLEYRFITQYLRGEFGYREMHDRLAIAIHQFAKRQMTWFRGMEHRGLKICWIDGMQPLSDQVAAIQSMLADKRDRFAC